MYLSTRLDDELRQLRLDHAALRESFARVKSLYRARKYNPNQPRVPAGNPDGGQWTSNPATVAGRFDSRRQIISNADKEQPWEIVSNTSRSDGTIEQQTVLLRDGAAIRSEFAGKNQANGWDERHLVMTSDGNLTTFENRGDVQTIRDANGNILGVSDWTRYGAQPEALLQPASFTTPYPGLPSANSAAVTLFG